MMRILSAIPFTAVAVAMVALSVPFDHAHGKIVCWKDASGKVVGCGDNVPAEYLGSATKELDKQGNVRQTGESTEELAKRRAKEQEQAQAKAEENKRLTEQKRQDDTLINTFSNVNEIDLKRDRELKTLDNFIIQQKAALTNANERLADARKRAEGFEKDKKPLPPIIKEDIARAEREKARVELDIAQKEKAKTETTTTYAEYRKRYTELKGPATAPTTTPAKK